jgi:hypothetical protein
MTQALYAHMNNKTIKFFLKECPFLPLLPGLAMRFKSPSIKAKKREKEDFRLRF